MMKRVTGLVIAAIVLALGWFLLSPLFIDVEVDEPLAFTIEGGAIDLDAVMKMPEQDRKAMRTDIMAAAANAADRLTDESMPEQPSIIASGTFVDADIVHKGEGRASLYALPNGQHVLRFDDFRVTNGPDLYVYLTKHAAPKTADDVTEAGFASLGKLKGNVGNQNYPIPAGVNVEDYDSVVIWCQLFGVLFSPASLETE